MNCNSVGLKGSFSICITSTQKIARPTYNFAISMNMSGNMGDFSMEKCTMVITPMMTVNPFSIYAQLNVFLNKNITGRITTLNIAEINGTQAYPCLNMECTR